jgi:hypothetical protein
MGGWVMKGWMEGWMDERITVLTWVDADGTRLGGGHG